jgi:hypothetical protein
MQSQKMMSSRRLSVSARGMSSSYRGSLGGGGGGSGGGGGPVGLPLYGEGAEGGMSSSSFRLSPTSQLRHQPQSPPLARRASVGTEGGEDDDDEDLDAPIDLQDQVRVS